MKRSPDSYFCTIHVCVPYTRAARAHPCTRAERALYENNMAMAVDQDQDQEPENDGSVVHFSTILFTDNEFQPLVFSIRPSATRARLKPLIEGGGGRVTSRHDPSESNVIKILADGDEHSSPDYLLASYIDDCVAANTLLDKSAYRVNSVNEDKSAGGTEVMVAGSTKGRSCYTEAEDEAILEYVAKHPYQYGGNKTWKRMELMKITNHSWQSMRDRFLKKLEGRLQKYTKKREENLLMKRQKEPVQEVNINESSDEDIEGDSTMARNVTQTKENIREDEASDTSSFDMDLYQAASKDLKSQEADGEKMEGTVDETCSPKRSTAPSSSDENPSRQAKSPDRQAQIVRRSTRQTNKEKSTKSPTKSPYKTRSRSAEDHARDEHGNEKAAVGRRKGKKNKGENHDGDSLEKEGDDVDKRTRQKKILENQDNKAKEKSAAKEHNNIDMDDIGAENGGGHNDSMQTCTIDDGSEELNGRDNDILQLNGRSDSSLEKGNGISDGAKNLDGMDDSEMQLDEMDDSEMQPDEMVSKDKSTQQIKKSRRSRDPCSPQEIVVVRLSSSKKKKTPVKSTHKLGTALKESQQESRQDSSSHTTDSSSIRRTPRRRSRRGMEIVSDSSASDDITSDVLPLKRTRHTSSEHEQTSSLLDHPDHPSDEQAEEDCEDYINVIEELCAKYKQTKSQICTALYVHSGDLTRVEEYLQSGSLTEGPLWSSSQDKLLLSSSDRQDISMRYSSAAINERLKWLQS